MQRSKMDCSVQLLLCTLKLIYESLLRDRYSFWKLPMFYLTTHYALKLISFLIPWKVKVKSLSRIWLFVTPWTVAYQAPPSMGFSRQEYWSGLQFPSPGDLPDPGIKPGLLFLTNVVKVIFLRKWPLLFLIVIQATDIPQILRPVTNFIC